MRTRDLGDIMREHGHHLDSRMTPLALEDVSAYQAKPRPTAVSRRVLVWSFAAVASVLSVAALYLAVAGDDDQLAHAPPPPTTAYPDAGTMTDLEVIEAGVAAYYSGQAERAVELFELDDRPDEQISGWSAYQAAIGGRVTLSCTEYGSGTFSCNMPYHNALTDAIDYLDSHGDTNTVVVEEGVITRFEFPEHSFIMISMGTFLAMEGRLDGYEECDTPSGQFPVSCATIHLENLDAWKEWYGKVDAVSMVESALESWYGGDCASAIRLTSFGWPDTALVWPVECATSGPASQTIEYESLLGAEVSVEGCEETAVSTDRDVVDLSCAVHYSNVMNIAVGKPPSVTERDFTVDLRQIVGAASVSDGTGPYWFETDYPEDAELRESFRAYAEGGELADAYAGAGCASARTPECANLVLDNLDAWGAWYETNG